MTLEFSIEQSASRIYDRRTREYFEEVKGCYNAGYYRSAIVMLWSVIICDLLYKLDFLANANGDTKAAKILKELETDRKSNPKDPAWEEKLVTLVDVRTEFFDAGTLLSIQTIQKHRHLSAHPVLKDNDLLYSPTQEVARAHQSVDKYVRAKYGPHLSSSVVCDLFRRILSWSLSSRMNDVQRTGSSISEPWGHSIVSIRMRSLSPLMPNLNTLAIATLLRSQRKHWQCSYVPIRVSTRD